MKPDESGRGCDHAVLGTANVQAIASADSDCLTRAPRRVAGFIRDLRGSYRHRLSAIRFQHVLEPHPLLVEKEIHVPARTVAVLEDEQLRRAVDVVIIDPLQAFATGARPLDEEMANAVRALKRLAVERDVCIIVTSGLPAIDRDRKDLRPQLDDLGALGAVKQFADVVLGLYRHEMYDSAPDVDGATELLVLKNRNGARGYVDLYFYKQWMRFEDMISRDRSSHGVPKNSVSLVRAMSAVP